MSKIKKTPRAMRPLESGQVWRMARSRLQVGLVGKVLVHYKLGKAGAVRVPNSVGAKASVERYLNANKAVLMRKKAA